MKLSTKGRYAMVALADIALQPTDKLVALGEISKRQDISLPYLEQLFVKLRRAELVESVRGPGGGYRLARPASDIRVVDILSAVDENGRRDAQGGRRLRWGIRQPGPIPDQPVVGKPERACLCVPASDAAFGCDQERLGPVSGGAQPVFCGGRIRKAGVWRAHRAVSSKRCIHETRLPRS